MSRVARKSGRLLARVGLAVVSAVAMVVGVGCGPPTPLYGVAPCINLPVTCASDNECSRCSGGSVWYCEKADGGTQGVCAQGRADAGTP